MKLLISLAVLFAVCPDIGVLKRFVFGFGSFFLPSIIIIILALLQYISLLKRPRVSLLLWLGMFGYIIFNIINGWPTGLMVNLVLTWMCVPMTFILALLFAIARYQNELIVLKVTATILIEAIRGVPLIGLMIFILSIGADMIPAYWVMPKIITLWLIYSLFAGVYLAEIFRGGFESISNDYIEGAYALGFNPLKTYVYILIPKVVIDTLPPAFNVYIGLFKETSLVLLFGYFDLMNIALNYLDLPAHYNQSIHVYIVVLILFWIVATIMHEYGRFLFKSLSIYEVKKR